MTEGRAPSNDERDEIKRAEKHPVTRKVAEEFVKSAQDSIAPKAPKKSPDKKRT